MTKSRRMLAAAAIVSLSSCGNPGDGNIDNGIANYAGPYQPIDKNLDQVAPQPAVLTIVPLPFVPGSSIEASASLNRPFLPPNGKACGAAQPTYEYRFRIVGLDAQGNPKAGVSSEVAKKTVDQTAGEGARIEVKFDPMVVQALDLDQGLPGPNARAILNLYSRVCVDSIDPMTHQVVGHIDDSDATVLATLDLRYTCGRRTEPCRYALAQAPTP